MSHVEGRRDIDERTVGNAPSTDCHADGRKEPCASKNAGRPWIPDWGDFECTKRLGKCMFEPIEVLAYVVCSESEVVKRRKESHAYLPGAVDDGATTSAREP